LSFFSCFPVFPYAHKKFSKSKQLAESIDDICNNIWNKKKQRPENDQTGDKQRPENDQTGDKQRSKNEQTGDKQRPENYQKGDKQRPENDPTEDKQRPENDRKGDTQRLEDGPQEYRSEASKSSVGEGISQARCQPMLIPVVRIFVNFLLVLRIRIRRIHMLLGLLDPDPLVRGTDPHPAPVPSII
jgi:hypothetical protein